MKNDINLCLLGLLTIISFNSFSQNDDFVKPNFPRTATQWQALTAHDIEYAYAQTAANHPGMYDSDNPNFPTLLEDAKQHALTLAQQVTTPQGYEAAIARFNTILQDGHAGAVAVLPDEFKLPRRWPEFSAVWRGDSLRVYYSEHHKVNKGDTIIRCNNTDIKTLMRETLFNFHGEVDQPGHWWNQGWRLLSDDGNPFLPKLKNCDFVNANGATYSVILKWSVRPKSVSKQLKYAYNGDELPIGLGWPSKNIAWVAMPTFSPNELQIADYQTLLDDLTKQRGKLLNAKTVVLDLRHNQGGSSFWSLKVAEQLWGEHIVNQKRAQYGRNTQVWWRASEENTNYVESLKVLLKEQPQMYDMVDKVSAGMKESLEKEAIFYVEEKAASTQAAVVAQSDFNNNVIVIVPGQCASACLDAIDTFKLFSNTMLLGAPSSADSTYMEVRLVDTPSGLTKVIIPNKVYVDRPRGKGAYYKPDIPFNELEWTTQALLARIKKL